MPTKLPAVLFPALILASSLACDKNAKPSSAPPSVTPASDASVTLVRQPHDWQFEPSCDLAFVGGVGVPSVSTDGSKFAYLRWTGSAGAAEEEGDTALVVIDLHGAILSEAPLWNADELDEDADPDACATLSQLLDTRIAQANALLPADGWRALERLPPVIDLVRDHEGDATDPDCQEVAKAPARLRDGVLSTCAGEPAVVEVALTDGPTLVIRQPEAAVYGQLPLTGLALQTADPEFVDECGSAPVLVHAWRDPLTNTLLLELSGEGYGADVCDYQAVFQVAQVPLDTAPPSDAPWARAPTWLEVND